MFSGLSARPIFLARDGEPSQPPATMMSIKVRFNQSKAVTFVGLRDIIGSLPLRDSNAPLT